MRSWLIPALGKGYSFSAVTRTKQADMSRFVLPLCERDRKAEGAAFPFFARKPQVAAIQRR